MNLLRYFLGTLLFTTLSVSFSSYGISLDSMFEFADEQGKAHFTVTNTSDKREFITVRISEMVVKEGRMVEVPYTRDNLDKWTLEVQPSRTVVESEFSKLIGVQSTGKRKVDRLYQLTVVPSSYFDSEREVAQAVQVAIGLSPLVVVPATVITPIQYDLSYQGKQVHIINRGQSFFIARFDTCLADTPEVERNLCSTKAYVMPGRDMVVDLPDAMQGRSELNAELSTYHNKYQVKVKVNNEGFKR